MNHSRFRRSFVALDSDSQRILHLLPGYLVALLVAEICAARVGIPLQGLFYGSLLLLLLGHTLLCWDRPFRYLPLVLSAAPVSRLGLIFCGKQVGWGSWVAVGLPVLVALVLALRGWGLLPSAVVVCQSLLLYAWGGFAALVLVLAFLLLGLLALPRRLFSWLRRVASLGLAPLRTYLCAFPSWQALTWPPTTGFRVYLVHMRAWLHRLRSWLSSPRPLRIALQALVLLPAVLVPLLDTRSMDVRPAFPPRANWRIAAYMLPSSPPTDAAVAVAPLPGPDRSLGRLIPRQSDVAVEIDDAAELRQYARLSRRAEPAAPEPAAPSPTVIALEQYPGCPAVGCGNPYPRGVCTWYVQERREDLPAFSGLFGLAENWAVSAQLCGFQVDQQPAVGAVIVFPPGANGASPGGHVGYVEAVGESDVLISECNVTYGSPVAISPTWWEAGYYCAHRRISFDWLDPRVQYIHELGDRSSVMSWDRSGSIR